MTANADRSVDSVAVHTLEEAATILRVKESWLQRQAAARKVPFTMLGGAYRFTPAHLAAIVRLHERGPGGETDASGRDGALRRSRARQHPEPRTVTPLRPRPRTGPRRAA